MVTRILIAFMLLTLGVNAQTIYVTDQNIFDLVPDRDALTGLAGSQRIKASFWEDPSFTEALDVTAGLPIQLRVSSLVDDYVVSIPNSITSTPPNVVWWVIPSLNAGSYRLQATVNLPGDSFPVFDRYLTLTSAVSAAAVVNLIQTNIINVGGSTAVVNFAEGAIQVTASNTVDASISSGAFSGSVFNIQTLVTQTSAVQSVVKSTSNDYNETTGQLTINTNPATGGTGNVSINGVTTNAFSFVGQFPVSVSNIGGTFYFGRVGGGGTFIPAGDSNQVFNFEGSVTQTFTVPSGVTQLYAYAWGAGGGGGANTSGGAGGYSFGYFSVTNGEVLSVVIGEGGFISSTTTATSVSTNTANPFPNGGWGASKHTSRAGAGGGSTHIARGTNLLVVAGGGGGGGPTQQAGGAGGGISGQDGFLRESIAAGGGATQTAGGTTGSTAIPLSITNTAGSFMMGGNGGLTTNLLSIAAGGGGGGYFGGSGGLSALASDRGGGGGGGSGHINASQGVQGTTVQAQTPAASTAAAQPPPATDDPLYGSPTAHTWGRGGGQNTAGSNGGMIIRWVQPS